MAKTNATVYFYAGDEPIVEIAPHDNGRGNNCYVGSVTDSMMLTLMGDLAQLDSIAEQIMLATDKIRRDAREQLERRAS